MRKQLVLAAILLTNSPLHAQFLTEEPAEPPRIQVGLDIAKPIVALLKRPINNYPLKSETYWSIEPLVRVQQANPTLYWVGQVGVTRFTGAPFNNTLLNMTGSFWKAGIDWQPTVPWVGDMSALLMMSVWQTDGTLTYPATAFSPFGAFTTPIPTQTGVAAGIELQGNRDITFGQRIALRFSSRLNFFWKNNVGQQVETPYIPGLGLYLMTADKANPINWLGITGGVNCQLFYTLNQRRGYVSRQR